jgi:PAS domain S-box-containing protein
MRRAAGVWLLYGPLALLCAGGAMALVLASDHEAQTLTTLIVGELIGLSFVIAGLIGHVLRPTNGTGRILAAVGFAFFAAALGEANASLPATIGTALQPLFVAVFVHLLVAFPVGRLGTRLERRLVGAGYVVVLAAPLLYLLFSRELSSGCEDCPDNAFLVYDSPGLATTVEVAASVAAAAILVATIVLLVRRWRAASAAYRRSLRLVLLTGGTAVGLFVVELAVGPLVPDAVDIVLASLAGAAFLCVPFAFLAGLLRGRFARGAVGRLVADLGPAPAPGQLRDALRDVLGDPTLEVGYWLPDLPGFVDIEGRPFDPHEHGAATFVDGEVGRIGVLVHDPALLDDRGLLDGVAAAASLALENERLHAELRARLVELEGERDFTRLVVDTAPAYFCVVDQEGRIVRYNRTLEEAVGVRDGDDVRGRFFWDVFVPPERETDVRASLALAAVAPRTEPHEEPMIAADGSRRTVAWLEVVIPDEYGQLRYVLVSGLDVTERRRHEDEQEVLRRVATLVATEPTEAELLKSASREVTRLFDAQTANISRYEGTGARVVGGWSATGDQFISTGTYYELDGDTVTSRVRSSAAPARVESYDALGGTLAQRVRDTGIRSTIAAPISLNGELWGVIAVSHTVDERFPPAAEHRLGDFAALISQALANAQARRALSALAEEQAALRRVATLVATGAVQEELISAVTSEIGRLFGAQRANTLRWDGSTITVIGGWSAPGEPTTEPGRVLELGGDTVSARVVTRGAPVRIDAPEELHTDDAREVWAELDLQATIGAPIIVDGEVWGVITVSRTRAGEPFDDGAERRLGDFAALVAQAIANAAARREVSALAEEQASLRRVATLVAAGRPEPEVLDAVSREVGHVFDAQAVYLCRWKGEHNVVVVIGGWSAEGELPFAPGWGYRTNGPSATIEMLETGYPAAAHEVGELRRTGERTGWEELGPRHAISAPVIVGGILWGGLTAMRTRGEAFPAGAEVRLKSFASLLAQAINNAEARKELQASRARIVEAADEERRKLERNLHDGAQQRLVAVSISLRLALAKLAIAPAEAQRLMAAAAEELTQAIDELRELARGIHPAILTDRGLGPALEALAGRAPLDVAVAHELEERLPPPVEAAAYYVVSESLTNTVKYAEATSVGVRISRRDGVARVEVVDDGIGGADPSRGSGLRGLADRVEALDGTLGVESASGGGTRVWAEIPA